MQENKPITDNLEVFYDVFDESCSFLYDRLHKNYFELFLMTANNILAGEVLNNDLSDEDTKELSHIYSRLEDVEFNVEEIRKAIQAQILKAIKEMNFLNGLTTPDSIGLLMAYFISRLNKSKELNICEPLIGSGNMLYTIANHLTANLNLYGCDHNEYMIRIAKVFADMLDLKVDLHLEDTLNLNLCNMDFVVFDMPNIIKNKEESYLPYKWLLHYNLMLKENGYIIGLVNNDFFNYDHDKSFKKELLKTSSIIALIELPDNMFKTLPKSIIIINKKIWDKKKFLITKIKSLSDVKEFNQELLKMESWFKENIIL